jgi:Domain of unknown function (DUF4352)
VRQRLNHHQSIVFRADARAEARRSPQAFTQIDGIPPRHAVNSICAGNSHNFLTDGSFLRRVVGLISSLPPARLPCMGLKMNRKKILLSFAALIIVCIALLSILALLNRRSQVVGLNQEIQYDDFAFAALGTRQAASIGNATGEQRARGVYTIVTMKIVNHARRVDFTFDKSTVILVDEQGNEYHWSADVQTALEATRTPAAPCAEPIPAGASCTTEVVFDVPAAARIAQVRISGGGQIGDVLDTIFYGKKRIALPPQ